MTRLVAEPASLEIVAGDSVVPVKLTAYDARGAVVGPLLQEAEEVLNRPPRVAGLEVSLQVPPP